MCEGAGVEVADGLTSNRGRKMNLTLLQYVELLIVLVTLLLQELFTDSV